jgi:hypothetical protein
LQELPRTDHENRYDDRVDHRDEGDPPFGVAMWLCATAEAALLLGGLDTIL